MAPDPESVIQRRDFLKAAGATIVFGLTHRALADSSSRISILVDANDPIASGDPVRRAAEQLRKAFAAKGVTCEMERSADKNTKATLYIVVAGNSSELAKAFPPGKEGLTSPESLRLTPGQIVEVPAILVSAIDHRGFIYGLLELAERVQFNSDSAQRLHLSEAIEEKPANEVRSVGRYFCSELEDKAWYYDKDFWLGYLDVLLASRFNRFNLGYGLEYDFPRGVTSDYLHFPYPYLFDVPGYNVRVLQLASPDGKVLPAPVPLSIEEQKRNFDALRFIAAETGARGLHFQLGIWTHAYQWTDSPNAYHRIEGLTPATHAAYCRDALAIVLKECPAIQGLTLRVHGESGIPEGSYPFWKTLFEAISGCGRKIEIDMHAKGVNQIMIDMAADTGMPVKLGAKYSAEHQSLGYNQADIRALEIPRSGQQESALFSVSAGARLFTRYGYGDFLKAESRYQLLFRLWPGTQRHLLSADPEMAAGYARTSSFCGAGGLDLMEPLTFKGREGSGQPGGRCAYADESLNPKVDWKKYEYYYRVWGRCLYNPDADPETWRRYLKSEFGAGASSVESALANAGRILPLLTSAHLPSASNHAFWPEMNDNMPIVLGSERSPYGDTPDPKCFGTVSPLDPQIFSTIVEYTRDLLGGNPNPKYSPIEVSQWLETLSAASSRALSSARAKTTSHTSPEYRRMEEDVLIQIALGGYFAAKLRSGVLFEIYQQTGSPEAGRLALERYKNARQQWAVMAERAKTVYRANVSYGDVAMRRGHWADRLPAIDIDIAAMRDKLQSQRPPDASTQNVEHAIRSAMGNPTRPSVDCIHTPPPSFQQGSPLSLGLLVPGESAQGALSSVYLHYRHVDQAERWQSVQMQSGHHKYNAEIPAAYTHSDYSLQYYFELRRGIDAAWFYPGFSSTLSNQPYYAITNTKV